MPLYLLNARDKAGSSELRLSTREAHLAWARDYLDKIAMGGPVLTEDGTMVGSTFVIDMPSLEDAQAWAAADPYTQAGLFESVEITAFKWLIGDQPS